MNIMPGKDKQETARMLGMDLSEYLPTQRKKQILLLLSGGSAFQAIDYVDHEVLGPHITISMLDERYDKTNLNNNFSQLKKEPFYLKAKEAGCHFIDTSVKENQKQEELARFFEESLEAWMAANPDGKIVAIMGVGPDGHTSGIMPFPESPEVFKKVFEGDHFIASYDAGNKNQYPLRITTTITFLREVTEVFVFMVGEEKAKALCEIKVSGSLAEVPARIIKELPGNLYVDSKLAQAVLHC